MLCYWLCVSSQIDASFYSNNNIAEAFKILNINSFVILSDAELPVLFPSGSTDYPYVSKCEMSPTFSSMDKKNNKNDPLNTG